ncbi:unnamed protein product [Phytophthora fragariaefolia]|uniref:Unnamed protein product n=1 Tax=Phytophthora fragariaefolia TaxID=1490495 RepID=A0A9W7CY45_9STRA|nr:unnamed protein product [Phytophthora fragariaefolia]
MGNKPKEVKQVLRAERAKFLLSEGFADISGKLSERIDALYSLSMAASNRVAGAVAGATKARFGVSEQPKILTKELLRRLEVAFTQTTYIGDALLALEAYLWRCWEVYNSCMYKAPYVAVVQSSGFGKSRMVFELARRAEKAKGGSVGDGSSSNLRLLYVCARLHKSTGYPVATTQLRNWLFPSRATTETMTCRLEAIYNYAVANWSTVQTTWTKLFTEATADESVMDELMKNFWQDKPTGTSPKQDDTNVNKNPNGKMVVLVVDEARSLLAEVNDKTNQFRIFRT